MKTGTSNPMGVLWLSLSLTAVLALGGCNNADADSPAGNPQPDHHTTGAPRADQEAVTPVLENRDTEGMRGELSRQVLDERGSVTQHDGSNSRNGAVTPEMKAVLLKRSADAQQRAIAFVFQDDFASAKRAAEEVALAHRELHGGANWCNACDRSMFRLLDLLSNLNATELDEFHKALALMSRAGAEASGTHRREAIETAGQSSKLLGAIGLSETGMNAYVLQFIAGQYVLLEDRANAERSMLEAIRVVERSEGPESPYCVDRLIELSSLFLGENDIPKAMHYCKLAKTAIARGIGQDTPQYVLCAGLKGEIWSRLGMLDVAGPILVEARARAKELGPFFESTYIDCTLDVAKYYFRSKRYVEAEPLEIEALAYYAAHAELPRMLIARSNARLGALYVKLGKDERAESLLKQSISELATEFGENSVFCSYPARDLGELYTLQGKHSAAASLLTKALATQEANEGKLNPELLPVLHDYASLLERTGPSDERTRILDRIDSIDAALAKSREAVIQESGQ